MTEVSSTPIRPRVEILGLPVDRIDMDSALALLEEFIASDRAHLVVTADSSGLVLAQSDPQFHDLVRRADLVTPDSAGVLWAAKRLGSPMAGRVSGVELVDRLCRLSADKGYRIYFLGAAPGVADLAAEKLRLKYPGCNIVGTRNGFFPQESDEVVAREIAECNPDILFVAMGIPRQEKFISATQSIIRARVAIGVGGSLDVFSGRAKRAPRLVQKFQMEWLWRLLLNPKKFTKVKALPIFVWMVLRSKR
jgi:N-acetylglucosaminyldiphosphoundecaprenol N-acetyl-beta-D-mannosaminyltransferase